MSVRQVWKHKTSTPKSSPPSQNDSPPFPPRVHLQSPSLPSYNLLRDKMINQLHNISTILDSHANTSNAYIHAGILTTSDYFLEEFADELAHITFPAGNDDLPFDAESDLLELEYLLNHDPIKDMDSILEDSVDENSLDDNLDDTISEEFTNELAPSESFPPGNDDMTDV
ncbi:hypothetical protein Tco_1127390, partial [Tanacetum coccineum]